MCRPMKGAPSSMTAESMTAQPITTQLAQFVAASSWSDIPAAVRREAQRSLLNYFGCALGGCRDVAIEAAIRALRPFAGPGQATVIGRSERFNLLTSAYLNAMSANVFDFDDTHLRTVIHPTAPIAPALFALAEHQPVSGAQLLHAFILGVDVACRVGNAISPGHYNHGFHITGTCGILGAAVGVAKLLGLDAQHTAWALGNAATQAAGLVESLGVMSKSIHLGHAARGGTEAAFLAREGFTGPDRALEGRHGFLNVLGSNADLDALTDGLGLTFEISANTYKPYPCGVVLNPVIDACLDLRTEAAIGAEQIEVVTVRGNPLLQLRADRPGVTTGREAKVSMQHSVAVAFLFGRAGVREYEDAVVNDSTVRALGRRVQCVVDASVPVEAAEVKVRTRAGVEHARYVANARGDRKRPLTDAEIETKLRELAAIGAPGLATDSLIEAVWNLEKATDASQVMRCVRR